MSIKRHSLVASADDPLSMLMKQATTTTQTTPLATVNETTTASATSPIDPLASPIATTSSPLRPSSTSISATTTGTNSGGGGGVGLQPVDPDEIVVDSSRARSIMTRVERKEYAPLYVGGGGSTATNLGLNTAANGTSVATTVASPSAARSATATLTTSPLASSSSSTSSTTTTTASNGNPSSTATTTVPPPRRSSTFVFKPSALPVRSRDWHPSPELTRECLDDWDSHGRIPGEKPVMQIPDVVSYNAHDDPASVVHSLFGVLFMTSYQLFLEPTQRRDRLGQAVQAIPLSTIDRIEIEKSKGGSSVSSGGALLGAHHLLNFLDIHSKDGRFIKFGFMKYDECKRAYDCLQQYVFPAKEEYLFAFYYRIKTPIPAHLDGWNLYDPIEEYKRQGINTIPLQAPASTQSEELRLSWANETFSMCPSYPRVLVVPSEKYITDIDLLVDAQFRSRGRIPVCTWKHPLSKQTIWRCSQPKVGMNNTRCIEDEKLLNSLTSYTTTGEMFAIYDARPRFNARANILAGKGFENPELYKNCVKKIFFCDIQNIHVMRESYVKLIKACQREIHDFNFLAKVNESGWMNHLACCLKATVEMVKAIDQDKISLLIHCSDGWDRTAQLAALCELCLDPFYRTTKGFFILIEKEWISFGHQFQKRTGHKDKNYTDDQRSCIFLQWCDTVFQLLQQFPRHFEFNSHLLVTLVHHLYSCRFGTFFYNSDMIRRRNKIKEKTVSLWTYFMCSPAAIAGEFTNALYSRNGNGSANDSHSSHPNAAGISSASSLAPVDVEESGRSSVGRGGGDGGGSVVGTVLYPSYSLKKLTLWTDYFLRFVNDQCEQVMIGNQAGTVPPHGATTTRMYSNEAVMQKELRKVMNENQALSSTLSQQSQRVRDLESELQQLKQKYALSDSASTTSPTVAVTSALVNGLVSNPNETSATNGTITAPLASTPSDVLLSTHPSSGATADSSPASSPLPDDTEDDATTRAAEQLALEALRQRLQKEVDANVQEIVEAPEDPTTL